MTRALLLLPFLLGAAPPVPPPTAALSPPDRERCDNRPVVMIVEGHIRDEKRLADYAQGIRASGLYQQLGGYYLISPRPVAVFEGRPPPDRSMLAVRFPCLAHARAFWNSRTYREKLVPLRSNPSAGDFTVTVHLELALPDYMKGRVAQATYGARAGSMAGIAQVTEDVR